MLELDHDNESRFSCDLCQESGIDIETREYCTACELGKRRMNLDRLAEPLRHHPFTDAMWVAHHSAIKSERAIAAADKALLLDRAQRAEAAKLNAEGRVIELQRQVEELRNDAWQPIETAPKDGTLILLGRAEDEEDDSSAISTPGRWHEEDHDGPDNMGHDAGFMDDEFQQFSWGRSFGAESYKSTGFQPTHWMPLPVPPAASVAQAKKEPKE